MSKPDPLAIPQGPQYRGQYAPQGNVTATVTSSVLPTGASTEATLLAFSGKFGSIGQKVSAASAPVVLASDQPPIPVMGAFWQAIQPVSLPSTTRGSLSQAEQLSHLATLQYATLHVLTQLLAVCQGRQATGDEADSLIAEFADCRGRTGLVN